MEDLIDSKVRMTNRLTEAKFNYTSNAIDIMCKIVRRMAGGQYAQMTFPLKELIEGMVDNNDKYDKLRKALSDIRNRQIEWYSTQDKSYYGTSLISGWKIDTIRRQATVNIDAFMLPVLLDLKKEFTVFQLQSVLKLQSKFSKRIYLMCCQFLSSGMLTLNLDELRKRLYLVDKYADYYDFYKRVLKTAVAEINEHSELSITAIPDKDGKRIDKICFIIELKKEAAQVQTNDSMEKFMLSEGMLLWQILNVFATLPIEEIRQLLYHYQLYRTKVKNRGAYLVKMFKEAGVDFSKQMKKPRQTDLEDQIRGAEAPKLRSAQIQRVNEILRTPRAREKYGFKEKK